MENSLPRPIQQKLEHTLAQWAHWQCEPPLLQAPRVVEVLSPGYSNFSILVATPKRFVVRIDGVNPTTNGLHRQSEWRTLLEAARRGIAPQARYFNPELGCMVCDFLEHDPVQDRPVSEVADLLRRIHSLPARHHRLDIGERVLRYEKLLQHGGYSMDKQLRECRAAISELIAGLKQYSHPPVLCHNDLLKANRIYSGGTLWAIDWEYCAMASPWYDIAVVANGDAMSAGATAELLRAYLGRAARDEERAALHHFGSVYCYLELLWYLAQDRPVLLPDEIERKTQALAERCGRTNPENY